MNKYWILLFVAWLALPWQAFAEHFEIDGDHSSVLFSAHFFTTFQVKGRFDKFSGVLEADPKSKSLQSVRGEIESASINSNQIGRDDHLRTDHFFYVKAHPKITFVSKKVTGKGNDITVVGDLTMRGVTKEVELKGSYTGYKEGYGKQRIGFTGHTRINRKDFDVSWNKPIDTGGDLIGDLIEVELNIIALKVQ